MKTFIIWKRELTKKLGGEEAARLIHLVQERYQALRGQQRRAVGRKLVWHLNRYIFPGLALYQELRAAGHAKQKALRLAAQLFEAWADGTRRSYARLGRLPFFFSLLRAVIRIRVKLDYPSGGWDTEWLEVSGERIAFNMRRCFYHDVMRENRAPELTQLFCGYDDLLFAGMSPGVRWKRKDTIARGGGACDFRFERVSRGSRRAAAGPRRRIVDRRRNG